MTTDLRRRGRRAKQVGDEWEREYIRDFHEHTGKKLSRQLRERREGNIGDIEIHPDVPFIHQLRKRKEVSVFKAVEDAFIAGVELGQETNYSVAVCQRRLKGSNPGTPNPRGIGMFWEDWAEVIQSFDVMPDVRPHFQVVVKRGKRWPNLWGALSQAQELVQTNEIAVGRGIITDEEALRSSVPEGVTGYAFVDYWGFLRTVGLLYQHAIW